MKLLIILIMTTLMVVPSIFGQIDPNMPDTVYIDSMLVFKSVGHGVIPINLANDEELSGVSLALTYSSTNVMLDSFSFVGGRLETVAFKGTKIDPSNSTMNAFAFGQTELIQPGNGPIGFLYFSWDQSVPFQTVIVDSTTFFAGQIVYTTSLSDQEFVEFIPQFRPGKLVLDPEPPELDSIWILPALANTGETFPLEIAMFNEDDVREFAFALDYDSELLKYDSISLNGTRVVPPTTNSPLVQNQNSSHQLLMRLNFNEIDPLLAGTGTIASLWFTPNQSLGDTILIMDTTSFAGVVSTTITRPLSSGGTTFTPFFNYGTVQIQTVTGINEPGEDHALPVNFALEQNYPNPFNPTTKIQFSLPESGKIKIEVFNMVGRKVRTLANKQFDAGVHEVIFDGRSERGKPLASGVYLYRLTTKGIVESKKMIMLK